MKNIYNNMMKAAAVIAVVFTMNSCLDKTPTDAIGIHQSMKTFSDAEQTLTGIYSAYMSGALYSGYLTLEADQFLNGYDESNILDGVRKLRESATRLGEMF